MTVSNFPFPIIHQPAGSGCIEQAGMTTLRVLFILSELALECEAQI